jgi:pimeloyl-ACP methyl ester carboxylesterase
VPTAQLADGLALHYIERGEGGAGRTPVLLIAGIPAIADDWDALAVPLSASRRVIAYDNRGSGGSGVPAGTYSTREMAGDAVALLDHLGIERSDVFGMSMGGMIAQELAIGWPLRVRRLILGCTHAGVAHAARQPRETARAFAMQTDDWAERMRALAPFAFASGVDERVLSAFVEKKSRDRQDPAGYRAQIAAVLAHDSAERLGEIRAPTLVITGDDDRVIPGQSSELLRERIPGARLATIGGAGHLFFVEQPTRTLRAIEEFLA